MRPHSASTRRVVGELRFGKLETDQHLEPAALDRGAHFGCGERIERGVGIARASSAGDALADVFGER